MGSLSSLRKSNSTSRSLGSPRNGRHRMHGGSDVASQFVYREWKVRIKSQPQGITVKRLAFIPKMEGPTAPFHHSLGKFRTKAAAEKAAKRFIDEWHDDHAERLRTAHLRGSVRSYRTDPPRT